LFWNRKKSKIEQKYLKENNCKKCGLTWFEINVICEVAIYFKKQNNNQFFSKLSKKSDLTLIEINVICEVPFYIIILIIIDKIIWLGTTMTKASKKKDKKKTFYGRRTDRRTTQNYSSEPHKIHKNKGIAILLLFYLGFRV